MVGTAVLKTDSDFNPAPSIYQPIDTEEVLKLSR